MNHGGIPRTLLSPEVHYRTHNSSSPVSILELDYQSTPLFQFMNIYFNIILQSTPRSSKWSLSLRFPNQNPIRKTLLPH